MSHYRSVLWIAFLGFVAYGVLACGGSRKIQSITVNPASADAKDYPDGKVPFIATGKYNMSPPTVTPLRANWAVASLQTANSVPTLGVGTDEVLIDANGVAQCAAGAAGTFSVAAWVALPYSGPPTPCPLTLYGSMSCPNVMGTTQLTCP